MRLGQKQIYTEILVVLFQFPCIIFMELMLLFLMIIGIFDILYSFFYYSKKVQIKKKNILSIYNWGKASSKLGLCWHWAVCLLYWQRI
jgi:hypothetical protein